MAKYDSSGTTAVTVLEIVVLIQDVRRVYGPRWRAIQQRAIREIHLRAERERITPGSAAVVLAKECRQQLGAAVYLAAFYDRRA